MDLAPKKDRFPSVGYHIHATPPIEHAKATPRHAFIGGS